MEGEKSQNICHLSWFEQPEEINLDSNIDSRENTSSQNIDILDSPLLVKALDTWDTYLQPENNHKVSPRTLDPITDQAIGLDEIIEAKQQKCIKRQYMESDENKSNKDGRFDKQHLYSKAYRQRKKEQYKTLQQENDFLKKRIKQLQYQLREQEIQLNRLKFPPPEKQLTIQELRREFLQKTVVLFVESQTNPLKQTKVVYTPQDPFYYQFLDIYGERGFAGTRKLKLLNYYFNQILEGILKDSERYISIMFARSKSYDKLQPLSQFQPLHAAFMNVFKPDEDLKDRMRYFVKNLYPLHLELNKYCSDFYHAFQSILECSQKIHNFIRDSYLLNMDLARKRIQLQTWFEFHKYGKMLRKLRFEWLDLIRSGVNQTQDQSKKHSRGTKKKKLNKESQ